MGSFDSFKDSPVNLIRTEGQEITLTFTKTGPTTARISWNIPAPQAGCTDLNQQAYDGIVVTLDTTPSNVKKNPVDGTVYTADPTADTNLHAGDNIDTALVIGAYYGDRETVMFDITGLQPNTAYYVSGFAVDNVYRYHQEGVHAYAQDYGNLDDPDTSAYHIIELDDGVVGTDSTGLLPATTYEFKFDINDRYYNHPTFPGSSLDPGSTTVPNLDHSEDPIISLDGTNAATYDDLVAEINKQFALVESPLMSAGIPNVGAYYVDPDLDIFTWNGATHDQIADDAIIYYPTDPTIQAVGTLWHETDNSNIYEWNGLAWDAVPTIHYHQDPHDDCDGYWVDGTSSYIWNGTVWCEKNLFNQTIDPSLPPELTCPHFWYDEINLYLYEWQDTEMSWKMVDPLLWATDPTVVALDDYWFNTDTSLVNKWDGAAWQTTGFDARVQEDEPELPAPGVLWYKPSTEELFEWDGAAWIAQVVKVASYDPQNPPTCAIWWDTTGDVLYNWDITTSSWDLISTFTQSEVDPSLPLVLTPEEDTWYNPTDNKFYVWNGTAWIDTPFINNPTDPTISAIGDAWHDTSTNIVYRWDGAVWNPISFIHSKEDPYLLPAGTYWYNTTGNSLQQWNGATWIGLVYSTVPLTPNEGDTFFNTLDDTLMVWDDVWVPAVLPVTVILNEDGHLKFETSLLGSHAGISIVEDDGDTLFPALTPTPTFLDEVPGTDGLIGEPTYMAQGVGTDGSPEERRELIDTIRTQLGYPVVDVELTKFQYDQAINGALEEYRKRANNAYKRAYFFMDVEPGKQIYPLTNERVGFNNIVEIMTIYRAQSSFLGTAEGQGVYGQLLLQHLYQLGTFDLVSYHLVNEYVETMGQLFAQGIQYDWHEESRELIITQAFWRPERILLDAMIEKTEQELIKDRYAKNWIENFAMGSAMLTLARIRGKYASLPGAGGGVALDAADLQTQGQFMIDTLLLELENQVSDKKEDVGMASDFIIG